MAGIHSIESIYFFPDFSIFILCCLLQTTLFIIWIYHICQSASFKSIHIENSSVTTNARSHDSKSKTIEVTSKSVNSPSIPHNEPHLSPKGTKSFGVEIQKLKNVKAIPTNIKLWSTLSITAGLLYQPLNTGFYTVKYIDSNALSCAVKNTGIFILATNRGFLYLYFLTRLQLSFDETVYAIKKWILIGLRLYLMMGVIFGSVFYYYYATINKCSLDSMVYGIAPLVIVDLTASLLCLFLMVYKLRQLLKNNNTKQPHLKYIISKLCVLTSVAIMSTGFGTVVYNVLPLVSLAGIDMVMNTLCLMLSFAHYDMFYKRFCILCRKCCEYR
eukprot:132016_1